jgi:hypothetical protein
MGQGVPLCGVGVGVGWGTLWPPVRGGGGSGVGHTVAATLSCRILLRNPSYQQLLLVLLLQDSLEARGMRRVR